MANRHFILLGLLCVVQQIACIGYYTVLAPRVLRPNSEYHVAVSTQMVSEPTTVIVGVVGTQSDGGEVDISQSVTVEPYSTQTAKLEIPDLGPGTYSLTASGIDGLLFTNTTTLDYAHKSFSVFIQTDKAEYKPGQKIQFRAIALDAHLKPSVTSALDIYISDGKGNRVKQWTQAELTKGVFSGELQLSDLPVLGDWTITVSLLGDTFTKGFEVAEYVLPKFEVTVDAPTDVSVQDSRIVATVHAKYTYGKAVEGEATVTVQPYSPYQTAPQNPVSKIVSIDGDAVVEFDIARDLRLSVDSDMTVQVDVSVAEALTGRVENTSFEVNLHKYKYKMDVIKTSDYLKPGLMYTVFVKVSYYDGSPVQDQDNPVTVKYSFTYDQEYIEEQHKLSKDGIVEIDLHLPDSNQTVLNLQAEYLDISGSLSTVGSAFSPSNTFIQAVLVTQNPTVSGDIELDISSTESMKYFSYEVIARGDVVTANTVAVDNEKTYKFKFPATYDMTPTAHVVVYYVKDDGEVIADAVNIDLDGTLQNFVNISINPTEAEPGNSVEMTIETKPNSYVGLLAVDQSVLLLKSGNDITQESVTEELKSYDTGSQTQSTMPVAIPLARPILNVVNGVNVVGGIRSIYVLSGSSTAKQMIENSGAVILTNGLVPENLPILYPRQRIVHAGVPVPLAVARNPVETLANAGPVLSPTAENPVSTSTAAPVRVRSNFPETWIWQMVEAGDDGKQTIQETAPDTITSWVITGFSLDPVYGLGLSESTKLTVFRPFFISLDLPYSVIRGEIISIPIVLFNYMTQDVIADVTLENEQLENFEFVDIGDGVNGLTKLDPNRSKRVSVKANSGTSVSFMVVPKKLGQVTIKVTATSSLAGDSVVTNLLVKPEGETQYSNKAVFVDLKNKNSFNTSITLDIPNNIVEGSDIVEITAIGDVLGPSISNLDNLLTMPTGCGEQTMLGFVPDIVVIEYLKNSNQLTSEIETRALQYMESGYQRELTYRHSDASFSAFGDSDPSGSTWLTAFVAKSFHQAVSYITIDEKVIQDALYWLSTKQSPSGSFPEVGAIVHKDMQGDAANGMALTAYTLIAFLENQQEDDLYSDTINKALDNIVKNLDGVDDIYALALSNYALNLAQHPMKDVAFNMFESKAQSSGDMKWWTKPIQADDENPWYSLPNSVDVEMTAYGLLTYLLRGMAPDALPIMKWLVSQRNERGGFASTQDTVIGLQALAKLAETFTSSDTDISVSFSYPGGRATPLRVNKENSMVLQMQELPETVRKVDITATGTGFALVQVAYQYNLNDAGTWPLFTVDIQVEKNSNSLYLYLSICSGFIGSEGVDESNMAVMEVNLPSGYTVDSDSLPSLKVTQYVKRVETRDGDTVVILYFDKMTKQEYCVSVSAFRTYKVAKQKPVPVTVYDYYDSSRRARVFYEHTVSSLCDICDGDDCGTACS